MQTMVVLLRVIKALSLSLSPSLSSRAWAMDVDATTKPIILTILRQVTTRAAAMADNIQ